jgi:hypothetical protein
VPRQIQIFTRIVITGILVMITSGLVLTPAQASTSPEPAAPAAQAQTVTQAQTVAARMALRAGDYCGPGANNWRSWMIPDHFYQADWSSICDRHDRCYSSRSLQDRRFCDNGMNSAMIRECAGAIANPNTRVHQPGAHLLQRRAQVREEPLSRPRQQRLTDCASTTSPHHPVRSARPGGRVRR